MSFIVGAVIGGVAAVASGAIASRGAKSAAKTAAAGSDREIEFNRESRDMARADQAPYREAGYTALNALMDMTGLSGSLPGVRSAPLGDTAGVLLGRNRRNDIMDGPAVGSRRGSSWDAPRIHMRADGGPISPDTYYNVSEIGPENVHVGGRVTRYRDPVTIDGQTGYVEPNIEGRYGGGFMPGGMSQMVDYAGRNGAFDGFGSGPKITNAPPGAYLSQPSGDSRFPNGLPVLGGGNGAPGLKYRFGRGGHSPPPQQPTQRDANGAPVENTGGREGGYSFQTDPGYNFRFDEGMRALEKSAAARGGLLSGGFGRKAIRYGQDYASGEYSNVYNRIANIAGLGQVANNQSGAYAMQAGAYMGNAAGNAGYALAAGQQAGTNAWSNAANQISQMPWGEIFNRTTYSPGGGVQYTPAGGGLDFMQVNIPKR